MKQSFALQAPFKPAGNQPNAIKKLVHGVQESLGRQTLLGVTGSGKTLTMASLIEKTQMPALVISHNKTLAAQLAEEFKGFFPKNAVSYFVSYYDYYQPEAYISRSDTYIAKDASINEEIDRLRHSAMESVLTRADAIVVASVSCIYGLGSPADYLESSLTLEKGQRIDRKDLLRHLTQLQYTRNDTELSRGSFQVRGDIIDIHPASEEYVIRVELFGPAVESIAILDDLTGKSQTSPQTVSIFPATFFITSEDKKRDAFHSIREELRVRLAELKKHGKGSEAARLEQRTTYDLEMIEQLGYVSGIENYSRHMDNRQPGQPPSTLIDYFIHHYGREGFLTFIDESHITIPQIGAMYEGDKARKKSLVDYGFRLPSAFDNRPLQFHEFENLIGKTIFVSATPGKYEINTSKQIVEQIIRPTGLLDPTIEIKPTEQQIDDCIHAIQQRIKQKQRVLVTTLTKRMAEDLSGYLAEMGIKSAYIHSDIDTLERIDILRSLRQGNYDVLVGINLLREGLDLPEVSLVAIMDADKEGYLRSETSLVQTMGRAARHLNGHVIMYADRVTGSMQRAISETTRRRTIQEEHNKKHGITPQSIKKKIHAASFTKETITEHEDVDPSSIPPEKIGPAIKELRNKMQLAAQNLEFERAAKLRDTIKKLHASAKEL